MQSWAERMRRCTPVEWTVAVTDQATAWSRSKSLAAAGTVTAVRPVKLNALKPMEVTEDGKVKAARPLR